MMKRNYYFLLLCLSVLLMSCSDRIEYTHEMAAEAALSYVDTYPYSCIVLLKTPVKHYAIDYTDQDKACTFVTPRSACWVTIIQTDMSINTVCEELLICTEVSSGKVTQIKYVGSADLAKISEEVGYDCLYYPYQMKNQDSSFEKRGVQLLHD